MMKHTSVRLLARWVATGGWHWITSFDKRCSAAKLTRSAERVWLEWAWRITRLEREKPKQWRELGRGLVFSSFGLSTRHWRAGERLRCNPGDPRAESRPVVQPRAQTCGFDA